MVLLEEDAASREILLSMKTEISNSVVMSCKPLGIESYLLGNSNAGDGGGDYATGGIRFNLHC